MSSWYGSGLQAYLEDVEKSKEKANKKIMKKSKEKQRRFLMSGLREYFYNYQYHPKHEHTFMGCDMFIDHEGEKIYTFYDNT